MFPAFVRKGEAISAMWANNVVSTLRSITLPEVNNTQAPPTAPPQVLCPFGKIVKRDGFYYINGGLLLCGDKNYNVADFLLSLTASTTKLLYITVPCESNMDDDFTIILPGILTSSKTSIENGDWTLTSSDEYPDNTNPTIESVGIGTIIIPLGQLTVSESGTPSFIATGCGTININQCGGTLTHTRAYNYDY